MQTKMVTFVVCIMIIEVTGIILISTLGSQGIRAWWVISEDNKMLISSIEQMQNDLVTISEQIRLWKTNSFYQEKVAREQLHMARPGDTVFFISKANSNERRQG